MNTQSDFYQHDKRWESQLNALEEKYRRALGAQEESWQKRVQEMERRNELERTWLQKEGEWRQRTDTLQDEIQRLNKELQGLRSKKKRKQWWKKRWNLGRRTRHRETNDPSEETAPLLSCCN
ncbi:hypothetical protein D9C73_000195 [Collichthys lucidus]|uniref:Uncharacterized protein n=1 Tax=Collichthys lucidus TaxID=240159 RepID=A0A4U5TXH7_COLLU|nr:hypothetical protein D9C73_000195 [Collichthys lucidus]